MKTSITNPTKSSIASSGPGRGTEFAVPRSLPDDGEAGGVTAEYAIAILTAAGFAGLLLAILQSDAVRGWLLAIVERALG